MCNASNRSNVECKLIDLCLMLKIDRGIVM